MIVTIASEHAGRPLQDRVTAAVAHTGHQPLVLTCGPMDPDDYDIDVAEVAEVWRRGSVIASPLLELTAAFLHSDPALSIFAGRASESGKGRWTAAAVDEGVPAHVLTAALYERFSPPGEADLAERVLSAMRKAFGGHVEKPGPA